MKLCYLQTHLSIAAGLEKEQKRKRKGRRHPFIAKGSPQSLPEAGWHHSSADQHPLVQKYIPDVSTLNPRSCS